MNPQWGVHVMMYDDSLTQVYLMQIQGGEKEEERRKEGRQGKEEEEGKKGGMTCRSNHGKGPRRGLRVKIRGILTID